MKWLFQAQDKEVNMNKILKTILIIIVVITIMRTVEAQVKEASGIPKILEVNLNKIVKENDDQIINVHIRNTGTDDTIMVNIYRSGNQFASQSKSMTSNEDVWFKFFMPISAVTEDTCYDLVIESKGWGGSDSKTDYYCVTDTVLVSSTVRSSGFDLDGLAFLTLSIVFVFLNTFRRKSV